ncbi:hypothetical protein P170DRAFT_439836 [Aspergillus steynii IBT 23096]|uniref:BZIP domain-containing protein n=1 Tax=Aspergillus steynii IBT 23096 TaxID=1392250 RepID=A0A2I2FZV7_9EURO|nr:uncharacterized protein P170DRAFT_439836 [Aspergillus steynii IBT 23096]PLB46167.1 hypothetical protein P170DRAFT_439836 [Aspergillus steynii IBT 23096]
MPRNTTENTAVSEGTTKQKRKPVRRDPEKRRQQNIRAQRKYREKLRGRMQTLETLAASLAQGSPAESSIQSESIPHYEGSNGSISCSSMTTPTDCQLEFSRSVDTASNLNSWDPTTYQPPFPDNTLSPLNFWDSASWDYTAQLSSLEPTVSSSTNQPPPSETFLPKHSVRTPPTHVDPSVLVHDKHNAGLDQRWTATVECDCATPHIKVQSSGHGTSGSTEVRIITIAPLVPVPDPYANHLRLETLCTLSAMDTLRLHLGLTEDMVCDEESPSLFYRPIRAPTDAAVKENMVCTVQRIFKTLKPDLRPSSEQITVEHPPYIDVLPFRTLRKNLILRQKEVDEDEFLRDILTGLVCWGGVGLGQKDRNASTGYASTGTPWDNRSWEAKAWFVKKYWSLLGGEDGELVRQSEWWRSMRGEDPLVIEEIA